MKLNSLAMVLFLAAASLFTACNKDNPAEPGAPAADTTTGNINIVMTHLFDGNPLQLLTQNYINAHGDTLNFEIFKYYLSNFKVKNTAGNWVVLPETYFLIDESNSDTKEFALTGIPTGNYTEVSFIIGIDSMRNCSGAQTGVLDPINGMFWDWNSGYLFVKLDGTSPQSPFGDFVYHLGGYKKPTNCIRWKSISFNGTNASVSAISTPQLFLNVNVAEFFKNPVTIDVSQIHHVTGGNDLMTLTDNYTDMWYFDHIVQ